MTTSRSHGLLAASVILTLLSQGALAKDIHVPEDARTIRKALRKAKPGDQIIVAPGRYRGKVVVRKPGITLRGFGAQIVSKGRKAALKVKADDVTVVGFYFNGSIQVRADDVALTDFSMDIGRRPVDVVGDRARLVRARIEGFDLGGARNPGVRIEGDGAIVTDNRITPGSTAWASAADGVISIDGDGATVSTNTVRAADGGTAVIVTGAGASLTANRVEQSDHGLAALGADAVFDGNVIEFGQGVAIRAAGPNATVNENRMSQRLGEGVRIEADGFAVTSNDISMGTTQLKDAPPNTAQGTQCPAIVFVNEVSDGTITGNRVVYMGGTGIEGTVSDTVVTDNVLTGIVIGESGIRLTGDGNVVEGNTVTSVGGFGIEVIGSGNDVVENDIGEPIVETKPGCPPHIRISDMQGVLVNGDDNTVTDNTITQVSVGGLTVTGGNNTVSSNTLDGIGDWGAPAMSVVGNDNAVDDNSVAIQTLFNEDGTHRDTLGPSSVLRVHGARNSVRDNDLTGARGFEVAPGATLAVGGYSNNVVGNTMSGQQDAHGVFVVGTSNVVVDNHVVGGIESDVGMGFAVEGNDNVLEGNTSVDVVESGFEIRGDGNQLTASTATGSGEHGIHVATGTDNSIATCEAHGNLACGLENDGLLTNVIGSTFSSPAEFDIFNTGSFGIFEGNDYSRLGQ